MLVEERRVVFLGHQVTAIPFLTLIPKLRHLTTKLHAEITVLPFLRAGCTRKQAHHTKLNH